MVKVWDFTMKRKADNAGINKTSKAKKQASKYVPAYLSKAIKQVVRKSEETKCCDTFQTQVSFYDNAPAVGDLCQIGQGAGINERVGLKVRPTGLMLRYNIFAASGNSVCETYRMIVVQDMRQLNSVPTITDYLRDVTGATGAFTCYIAPKNFAISPNFKILFDEQGVIGRPDNDNGKIFGKTKKMKDGYFKEVHFKGATSTIGDNSTGRIWIIFMTDHGGATNAPQIMYHARMYYKDN